MGLQALQEWVQEHKFFSLMNENLEQAVWLNHWNCPLSELPEEIGLLRSLTRIDLRHLPESLGQLRCLEDLTSMCNELEGLTAIAANDVPSTVENGLRIWFLLI